MEAWRLKMEPWKDYLLVVSDSNHLEDELDLDPHQSEKLDPDPHLVKSWIRSRIKVKSPGSK
jgi:hypothetical protein